MNVHFSWIFHSAPNAVTMLIHVRNNIAKGLIVGHEPPMMCVVRKNMTVKIFKFFPPRPQRASKRRQNKKSKIQILETNPQEFPETERKKGMSMCFLSHNKSEGTHRSFTKKRTRRLSEIILWCTGSMPRKPSQRRDF